MALMLTTGVLLGVGGGIMNAVGGFRQAQAAADRAREAAKQQRFQVAEEFSIAQANIQNEEIQLMQQATAHAHQTDVAQRQLSAQAAEQTQDAVIQQAMRGTTGTGIERGIERSLRALGGEQERLSLARAEGFNRYQAGLRSVMMRRDQMDLRREVAVRDIRTRIREADEVENEARRDMRRGIASSLIMGAASFGFGVHRMGGMGEFKSQFSTDMKNIRLRFGGSST